MKKIIQYFNVFFILVSLFFTTRNLSAHPHMFITKQTVFVFNEKGLEGVFVNWEFDEFSSVMISEDFDINKNGKFEANEESEIKKNYFDYLKNYNYFTDIEIDKKPFKVQYIKNFRAFLIDKKVRYSFFIPCYVAIIKTPKKFVFSQYDPTYYAVLVDAKKKGTFLKNAKGFQIKKEIKVNKKKYFKYGAMTINPVETTLEMKRP